MFDILLSIANTAGMIGLLGFFAAVQITFVAVLHLIRIAIWGNE